MKKLLLSITLVFFSISVFADSIPEKPANYVNDYADVINQNSEDSLNSVISNYQKESGMEICVVTINSLDDNEISDFSQNLFTKWGIGKSSSNNGILLLVSVNDHRARIHTGYGAEIVLPDLLCKRLQDSLMIPEFKEGNYTKGIMNVIGGIINTIGTNSEDIKTFQNQYITQKEAEKSKTKENVITGFLVFIFIVILIVAFFIIFNILKKIKERKEECRIIIEKIKSNLKYLKEAFVKYDNIQYIRDIKNDHDKHTKYIEIPLNVTSDDKTIKSLNDYLRILIAYSENVNKFIKTYNIALNISDYTNTAKSYIKDIDEAEKKLEFYHITRTNKYTDKYVDELTSNVLQNISTEKIFETVSLVLYVVNNLRTTYTTVENKLDSIPSMRSKLSEHVTIFDGWVKKLDKKGLHDKIKKLTNMKSEFDSLIILPESELFIIYDYFTKMEKYVNSEIRKKEDEEESERRRIQDEEDEERRRRDSYNTGYGYGYGSSSIGGYDSGGSSSSFGGFGGGSSGGGGANSSSW